MVINTVIHLNLTKMIAQVTELKQRWEALKVDQPNLRIRNAAQTLGVSEAELLITKLKQGVTRLQPKFAEILTELESLGKVMALTRNDECVHERKGVYLNPDFSSPHGGLFVGEDIDLRIFLTHWASAFAVEEDGKKSLQFFGKDGLAMHKIYLTKKSNEAAYYALVEKYKQEVQDPQLDLSEAPAKKEQKPESEIDVQGFQQTWKDLKDTHHFFGMLRKFEVTRLQALSLAPDMYYAHKLKNEVVPTLLEKAAESNLPIMAFVGNYGNIQIHTGPIKRVLWYNSWVNVMDPDFNLHLDTARINQVWVVRKPTEDGVVTAIEVFNETGEIIVQFFGKRKPGIPELENWRNLVSEVETEFS